MDEPIKKKVFTEPDDVWLEEVVYPPIHAEEVETRAEAREAARHAPRCPRRTLKRPRLRHGGMRALRRPKLWHAPRRLRFAPRARWHAPRRWSGKK